MRRRPYDEVAADSARHATEAFVTGLALTASLEGDLRPLATVRYDGWTVRAYTWGLDRADGGVLVLRSHTRGQRDYAATYYAERWLAEYRERRWHHGVTEESVAFARIAEALQMASAEANGLLVRQAAAEA